ncbi:hypothetical protein V495_06726 [Pseudogymnoascus sp. VKM F-4514 (FW-929)]|nr:hypothetical protein V490_04019 [Pseudogymnoascus sp. VKM F-3557]KFY38154.1 hypothetical protein V495_06726 [Pseudogymnoascus sp. VKM F-4514 (FW-929)]KFY64205.1 hypothetical protein V497_01789 [Pseudogymnoascus sp. VKM F-4516 (FW-969)]
MFMSNPGSWGISNNAAALRDMDMAKLGVDAVQVIHALGLRLGITLLGNGWDNKQLKSPPRIPLFPALRARISSLARTLDRDFAGRDSQRPPATDRIINVVFPPSTTLPFTTANTLSCPRSKASYSPSLLATTISDFVLILCFLMPITIPSAGLRALLFQHDDIFLKSIYFLIEFFSTASSAYTCDTRTSVNER